MDYIRDFWRRHRRKIYVTAGCVGSGYLLYKLYNAHTRRLADLEGELAKERENEEFIKTQMRVHFESIQAVADTTTLPHAMQRLSIRIAEELDSSNVMERLSQGKGSLTPLEKLELWNQLKISSFTRMLVSLWAVTVLSLYIRVQVNILGRHLYIDTAKSVMSSHLLEDLDLIDRDDEQKFLESADFLANHGMSSLISNMQVAVTDVLKGKQLKDVFNTVVLHETLIQILYLFMSTGNPHQWVDYLMPRDTRLVKYPNNANTLSSDRTKFDQLMEETREVLSSKEFGNVAEVSLKSLVGELASDMESQCEDGGLTIGMPLAKLIPRVERVVPTLTDEPSKNRFVQFIFGVPEVELFFTLLYANMPTS